MLKSIRRSFGMSPSSSSSNIQADYAGTSDVLSPSNKPNTFIPLRRSNSFTNFFSSSRSSSPVKEKPITPQDMTSPAKATSSSAQNETQSDLVLAFLVLVDKKGRQKQRYPIQSLKTTMGRSIENDVRFLVSDVSRHHCTIEIEIEQDQSTDGKRAFLQVLGANGVLLNGAQVLPAPRGAGRYELQSGDSIIIAKRSFLFELPHFVASSLPSIFPSPVKGSSNTAMPQTPATTNKRRVRMSLVNAAQIDTPARPRAASPKRMNSAAKPNNPERDTRRANGLQRFMQSANVSPSKAKKTARQSLTSSTSAVNMFATPVKSRNVATEPKTAPPKQISFSLYSNGKVSPVKQMRMMPPLDTMAEEQDSSFRSENEPLVEEQASAHADEDEEDNSSGSAHDDSDEDIVIVEEIRQDEEPLASQAVEISQETPDNGAATEEDVIENDENIPPSTPSGSSTPIASPSKSGSPKRAKRRSSFFGRAGPFKGMSLGFYAEERTETSHQTEPEAAAQQPEELAEDFHDASDVEPTPMDEEELPSEPVSSPVRRRVVAGISQTPQPVKNQHFAGLTPLPRRPRLSLATKRHVSLRTRTLLQASEAYADRLYLPPPPTSPGMSKSMSMPSNLSAMTPIQALAAPGASTSSDAEHTEAQFEQEQLQDYQAQLEIAASEEEPEKPWKDEDDDEDEVDQSLSVLSRSPSPQKAPVYSFSPVKSSAVPQFATPQPMSKSQARRISMPPAGAADGKPSIRSALIRLQITGAGERIVHETSRKSEVAVAEQSSPSKARKVVRVSDVGLPATELSMGFDLVQDSSAEQESEKISEALNELFTAEEEELTDDEADDEDDMIEEEVVQISSKSVHESPSRPSAQKAAPMLPPQTPAALDSVRHLFSAASAAPATPDMRGLTSMLNASPEKTPQYGMLGDRMRANPGISELLLPSKQSPKKQAAGLSPAKSRRGVRRSEAAESPVALPSTPRAPARRSSAAIAPLPAPAEQVQTLPAFEAELHVTTIDSSAMDAENEALAQAIADSSAHLEPVWSRMANNEAAHAEEEIEEPQTVERVEEQPIPESAPTQSVVEVPEPVQEAEAAEEIPVVAETPELGEATPSADDAAVESAEAPAAIEDSPVKPRTSRRAASASPVKRTARSASPTKRAAATRSSPVKRSAAPPAEVVPEEIVVEAVQEAEPEFISQAEAVPEPEQTEPECPVKPVRRAGGRKAESAATEAARSSPEKPARRPKAAAAKKVEVASEESQAEETAASQAEEDKVNETEHVEEPPKRAARTRATRATTTSTKATRSTRTRATTKSSEPAVPSSSAAYGDDEASEEDLPAPTVRNKRAVAPKTQDSSPVKPAATRTARGRPAKGTARSTRAAATSDADEVSDHEHLAEEQEEEVAPAPKGRAKAAATKTTRTKAASTTTAKRSTKAKKDEEEVETASSATTASTTRSGRPRRAAAAK